MADNINTLLDRFTQQEESARTANLQRYQQAMQIYDEIIARYRPGGEFGKAALGQLEKRKVRDVGKETQQLISSGLYGTTTMASTGRRWEEAVGGPERLKLEDLQMQRLSQAQMGKAGFMERREDIGPDPSLIAGLASQVGQAPTQQTSVQRTYGGTYGAGSFPDMFSIGGEGGTAAPSRGYTGQTVTGGKFSPVAAAGMQTQPSGITAKGEQPNYYEWKQQQGITKSVLSGGSEDLALRKQWMAATGRSAALPTPIQQTTSTYKPKPTTKYAAGYGSPTAKF